MEVPEDHFKSKDPGGKTEAVIRFTLQRGEVKKGRRGVLHALRHFGHRALFPFAAGLDGLSLSLIPDAV